MMIAWAVTTVYNGLRVDFLESENRKLNKLSQLDVVDC